ncbi:MAG: hypothetical protein B7Y07_07235 [Halothiobacillus sp. 24-54-40]|jgi:hypothetical protein|nr:MAG: hypothetical protein B7Y58_05070 [Halothiobacillus sp. 35-54-62]OYZ86632.1 MAG: hypothetical protein B7Y07_07235 [Halothiobacillus sp. 24-54-40]OZA81113.1 MAG: hypothetical protein B7X64_03005 [Halothiobacillus sp. 39-53-45]HQS03464.1 DUF4337 domain-containing protein [Halothiobacillus sp.]HUN00141.1 DUF4337 domain-containing protein [Halothiobacillus sp.]
MQPYFFPCLNEAVLKKTKATDEWNYYQAVSTKSHLMALAVDLTTPNRVAGFKDQIAKYTVQKVEIKQRADALEQESEHANAESARLNKPHHDLEIAMIFFQISISLASITALTGRRWLFGAGLLSATARSGAVQSGAIQANTIQKTALYLKFKVLWIG